MSPLKARNFGLLALVSLAGLALAPPADAGGFSNPDFGIRRLGMLAVVARPDDATAVFHNPAGLTLSKGWHLYHAESWFLNDSAVRFYDSEGELHPDHEVSPETNWATIPFFGATTDLGIEELRLGLAVFAPNAYGAVLPDDEPSRYHVTEALFVAGRASFSAAWALTPRFSVGATISAIYVHLNAKRYMNQAVLADPDKRFEDYEDLAPYDFLLEVEGHDWTWAMDLGVLFEPLDTLRFGAVFAGGSDVNLEGNVRLTAPDGGVTRTRQHTHLVIPFALRAGINWEFAPDFELSADIRYWHYQVFQEQRTELDDPVLGMNAFVDPKDYSNSWNWCVGLLYRVIPEVEVMMGYQEDYTPIPDRTYSLENPSRDQRGVSAGLRWQITDDFGLGLAVVRNWFELVDVQTSMTTPPSNVKGYGNNTELGFDLDWRL